MIIEYRDTQESNWHITVGKPCSGGQNAQILSICGDVFVDPIKLCLDLQCSALRAYRGLCPYCSNMGHHAALRYGFGVD